MKGHKNRKAPGKEARNQSLEVDEDLLNPGTLTPSKNKNIESVSEEAAGHIQRPTMIINEQIDIVLKPDKPGVRSMNTNMERNYKSSGGNGKAANMDIILLSGSLVPGDMPCGSRDIYLEKQGSTSEGDSVREDLPVGVNMQSVSGSDNKRKLLTSPGKVKSKIPKKDNSFIQEFPKMDSIQSGVYCGMGNSEKMNTSASQTYKVDKSNNDISQNYNNREASYWRRKYAESCKEISNLKNQMVRLEQRLQQYARFNEMGRERFHDTDKVTDNESYPHRRGYSSRDTCYGSQKGNRVGQRSEQLGKKISYKNNKLVETNRELRWLDLREENRETVTSQNDYRQVSDVKTSLKDKNPELVLVKVLDHIMSGLDKVVGDIRSYRCDLFEGTDRTNIVEGFPERSAALHRMEKGRTQLSSGVSENLDNDIFNVDTNMGRESLRGNCRMVEWGNRDPERETFHPSYQSDFNSEVEDGRSQGNFDINFNRENIRVGRNNRDAEADLIAMRKKIPRSAVVHVYCEEGSDGDYSDILKRARHEICIEKMGISKLKIRKAFNGGIIIEIFEEDASEKARLLAGRLHSVFEKYHKEIRISCPVKKVNLALTNIIEIPSSEDVIAAVTRESGCDPLQVQVGRTSKNRNGTYMIRFRCPIPAAVKLLETRSLRLGWSASGIVWLRNSGSRCFRCWATGHVSWECPMQVSRCGHCFRCGEGSHIARDCSNPVSCPVCKDRNLRYDHLAGGISCMPVSPIRRRDLNSNYRTY